MEKSVQVTIDRASIMPRGSLDRVAWIEAHGVIEEKIKITASAELALWAKANCAIELDGSVSVRGEVYDALRSAISARLHNDPTDRNTYDATPVLQAVIETIRDEVERKCRLAEELEDAKLDDIMDEGGDMKRTTPLSEEADKLLRYQYASAYTTCPPDEPFYKVLAAIREERDRRRDDCRKRNERLDEEKQAARKAEKALREANIREWVKENGDEQGLPRAIIRAAEEGRDVSTAVEKIVDKQATDEILKIVGPIGGSFPRHHHNFELSRRVPTDKAYLIRDTLVNSKGVIAAAAMLPDVDVKISDFGRIDVNSDSKAIYRGCIEIEITHPWFDYDFGSYVLTEPDLESDDEDDDEHP